MLENWSHITRILAPAVERKELRRYLLNYLRLAQQRKREFPGLDGYFDQQERFWQSAFDETRREDTWDRQAIINTGNTAIARLRSMERQLRAYSHL